MTLYMAVTADEYELPMIVEDAPFLLADKLGKPRKCIREELSRVRHGSTAHTGKIRGYRLTEVEVEDGD
jgi:hypothetical protein